MTDVLHVAAIVLGSGLLVLSLYGIWRTADVRPRSPHPELAPLLYVQFGGIGLMGIIFVAEGML